VTANAIDFPKTVPPFQFLSHPDLEPLAATAYLEYFPL